MRIFETPGVYYETADASAGGVFALRSDIAGFVGIAQRGPLHLAVPLESFRQFETWFGGATDQGYLAYSARAFFENGGRRLWAVRVASETAGSAALTLRARSLPPLVVPAWRIEASSPGVWGDELAVRVSEVRRAQSRARPDRNDPARLAVDSIAGFERHAAIELLQPGTPPQRAVVIEVDAAAGSLRLDRALAVFGLDLRMRAETVAYTIEVFRAGRLAAQYADLSLVPEHPRYGPAVLRQPWQTIDPREPERAPEASSSAQAIEYFRVARGRRPLAPPLVVVRELRGAAAREALELLDLPAGAAALAGGADGLAALTARDFVGEPVSPFDSDAALAAARRGLAALEPVDEVALLAVPDIHIQPRPAALRAAPPECIPDPCLPLPPMAPARAPSPPVGDQPPRFGQDEIYLVQAAMIAQCEQRRDRIALLDPPFEACTQLSFAATGLRAWRSRFDSAFAALYAPWLGVVDPLRGAARPAAPGGDALTRLIPPSGHVAGQIAASDLRRGVHVAPANAPLGWIQRTSLELDAERHGLLNTLGVNVIRAEPGRGLRVLGARTLSSDSDWRFLNVRRLVSMVAKAIGVAIQWAVFEPNEWRTRAKLALVIGSFLQELWERGAFVGATADAAFFVRCDDANNPPEARARGELLVQVGVAPSVPYEFIVLRIGRDANGFAVAEAAAA